MIDNEHLCFWGDRLADLLRVDIALPVAFHKGNRDTVITLQVVERSQHGVVFEPCRHYVVALCEQPI